MCCSLEGRLKCGFCEGWTGFGKHGENSEKDGRQRPEQTPQQTRLLQTSEWDLFYNRLLQTPEEFRMWKPPINVKVIPLRCLRKSVGVLPRGSLCFVTWTCWMTFLKDAQLRVKDRAGVSVLSSNPLFFHHLTTFIWIFTLISRVKSKSTQKKKCAPFFCLLLNTVTSVGVTKSNTNQENNYSHSLSL